LKWHLKIIIFVENFVDDEINDEDNDVGSGDGWVSQISDDEERRYEGGEVDHPPHQRVVANLTGLTECQEYFIKVVSYFQKQGVDKYSDPTMIKVKLDILRYNCLLMKG